MFRFFLKKFLEYRIHAALKDHDFEALQQWLRVATDKERASHYYNYQFSSGETVIQWLMAESARKRTEAQRKVWYQFSSTARKKRLSSQDDLLLMKACWEAVQLPYFVTLLAPKPSWYHRFFSWARKKLNLEWNLVPNAFDEQNFPTWFSDDSPLLSIDRGHSAVSLKEKYTPLGMFKRLFRPKEDLIFPLQAEPPKRKFSSEEKHSVRKPMIVLAHQIDQAQQQQQTSERKVEIKTEFSLGTRKKKQFAIDNSQVQTYHQAMKTALADTTHNFTHTRNWVKKLKVALGKSIDLNPLFPKSKPDDKSLLISEAALEVLQKAQGEVRCDESDFFLERLPLGFFIEETSPGVDTLKFSKEYREYQLTHDPDACLLLDPYGMHTPQTAEHYTVSFHEGIYPKNIDTPGAGMPKYRLRRLVFNFGKEMNTHGIVKMGRGSRLNQLINQQMEEKAATQSSNVTQQCDLEKLQQQVKEKGIELTEKQITFLENHEKELQKEYKRNTVLFESCGGDTSYFPQKSGNLLFATLMSAAKSEKITATQWVTLLDLYISFQERSFTNCFHLEKPYTLLEIMSSFLSSDIEITPTNVKELQRLLTLNDTELSWFYLLVQRPLPGSNDSSFRKGEYGTFDGSRYTRVPASFRPNFHEISKALFYFFDYFKNNSLALPKTLSAVGLITEYTGFIRLGGILKCIELSKDPALQVTLMANIPENIPIAVAQLRAGYAVVHQDMYFHKDKYFETLLKETIPEVTNAYLLTPEQFSKLDYQDRRSSTFYKAMYLRYLAYNCTSTHFSQGLAKWNSLIAENDKSHNEDALLKEHWSTLKSFALSCKEQHRPLAEEKKSVGPYINLLKTQEENEQQLYKEADLTKLPFSSDDHLTYLKSVLNPLNEARDRYANLSAEDLRKQAIALREQMKEGLLPIHLALAILRELHFRNKREWLRLEQVVCILLSLKKGRLFQVPTAEGKALIIQMTALLQALLGNKVDVLTHSQPFATRDSDDLQPLASWVGLTVTKVKQDPHDIIHADIHYQDIGTAVINKKISQFFDTDSSSTSPSATRLPGARQATIALIDEADNFLDIHANTLMQISVAEESKESDTRALETFLHALNSRMDKYVLEQGKTDLSELHALLQLDLNEDTFYKKYCENNEKTLDYWIQAAYARVNPFTQGLQLNCDYVLEQESQSLDSPLVVRIVHKDSTGRIDKIGQWSAGVHQCVSAYEKSKDPHKNIKIPPLSQVIAEGNISHYLNDHYTRCYGFSATLGEPAVRKQIKKMFGIKTKTTSLCLPNAKRPPPELVKWPKQAGRDVYSRGYHFTLPPAKDRASHFQKLAEALRQVQEHGYSCIVAYNTIQECEEFSRFLSSNGVDTSTIQILDDTNPGEGGGVTMRFHPPEEAVVRQASQPEKLTATTAAGSRGTNFKNVTFLIFAKPSPSLRVKIQKQGRVNRNGELGVSYELYCEKDLAEAKYDSTDSEEKVSAKQKPHFRRFITALETKNQESDLRKVRKRKSADLFKEKIQKNYLAYRAAHPKEQEELEPRWMQFFSQVNLHLDAQMPLQESKELQQEATQAHLPPELINRMFT